MVTPAGGPADSNDRRNCEQGIRTYTRRRAAPPLCRRWCACIALAASSSTQCLTTVFFPVAAALLYNTYILLPLRLFVRTLQRKRQSVLRVLGFKASSSAALLRSIKMRAGSDRHVAAATPLRRRSRCRRRRLPQHLPQRCLDTSQRCRCFQRGNGWNNSRGQCEQARLSVQEAVAKQRRLPAATSSGAASSRAGSKRTRSQTTCASSCAQTVCRAGASGSGQGAAAVARRMLRCRTSWSTCPSAETRGLRLVTAASQSSQLGPPMPSAPADGRRGVRRAAPSRCRHGIPAYYRGAARDALPPRAALFTDGLQGAAHPRGPPHRPTSSPTRMSCGSPTRSCC